MKQPRRRLEYPVLAGLAAFLAGCATAPGIEGTASVVDGRTSMVRFYGPALKGSAVRQVAYANPWEYEEYAGVQHNGLRLELVYVEQLGDNTAVEYPFTRQAMVQQWRHNAAQSIRWGDAARVPAPYTDFWFRRYSLVERRQDCAAFDAEWDSPSLDPMIRPGKVIFGYLCAAPGVALGYGAIEQVLGGIGLRGITERVRPGDPGRLARGFGDASRTTPPERAAALALARSGFDASAGVPGFPFDFVVTFPPGDGVRE